MSANQFIPSSPTILLRQVASSNALYQAWRKVRANRGAPGIDAISLQEFEHDLQANLVELSRNLLNRTYEPLPARYVNIPKSNGKDRELAIPAVRDRVAQRSVLDHIEPLFEPHFLDCNFAFRPGRSVEMAIQRIVVARAQGFRWIVDSDIKDFFPSIDHALLLEDITRTMDDPDVLHLIRQWLDADVFESAQPITSWIGRWRSSLAAANLAARDAISNLLDDYVYNRLGAPTGLSLPDSLDIESAVIEDPTAPALSNSSPSAARQLARAGVRRLIEDGFLLALSQRALLGKLLNAKLFGLGGAAIALAALAPSLLERARKLRSETTGALQGAPISPLLSNIHLHPFDAALTKQGYRLVRYCDDFVILCRTEAQACQALLAAKVALKERQLEYHPDKTRLVSPAEPFDFLGYHFSEDGRIVPPASVPEVVTRQIVELANRYAGMASRQAGALASSSHKRFKDALAGVGARLSRTRSADESQSKPEDNDDL